MNDLALGFALSREQIPHLTPRDTQQVPRDEKAVNIGYAQLAVGVLAED